MSIRTAYTYQEAVENLTLCKEAYRNLISGEAKAYRIGTREYTALDLDDLVREIERWSDIVDALSGNARTKNVVRVVPRDL